MSDWVAELIQQALRPSSHQASLQPSAPPAVCAQPRGGATLPARHAPARMRLGSELESRRLSYVEKKAQQRFDHGRKLEDDDMSSVYTAPPFWAQPRSSP